VAQDLTPLPPIGGQLPPPAPAGPAAPAPAAARMPHRRRFRLVFAVLGVLAAGAVAATVVFAVGGRSHDTPWSSWHPVATGFDGAQQIADQVGHRYRAADGADLRDVVAGPLLLPQQVDIAGQAFLTPAGLARVDRKPRGAFEVVPPSGNILLYELLVPKEGQGKGTPTSGNGLMLLRREAVELSLHSFRYLPDFDRVITLIQTGGQNQPNYAILLRRKDVQKEISHPLDDTLSAATPSEAKIPVGDRQAVLRLTQGRFFQPTLSHAPDGTPFIVLDGP
jgi:hypothetical protein